MANWYDEAPKPDEVAAVSASPSASSSEETGLGESMLRGAAQGASMGFADEAAGAVEAAGDVLFGPSKFSELVDRYRQRRDESREEYKKAHEAHPVAYTGSELGGALGSMLIPGVAAAKGVGGAAKLGALAGLGAGQADLTKGELLPAAAEVGGGAVLGAGIGALAEKAIPAISGAVKEYAPKAAEKLKSAVPSLQPFLDKMKGKADKMLASESMAPPEMLAELKGLPSQPGSTSTNASDTLKQVVEKHNLVGFLGGAERTANKTQKAIRTTEEELGGALKRAESELRPEVASQKQAHSEIQGIKSDLDELAKLREQEQLIRERQASLFEAPKDKIKPTGRAGEFAIEEGVSEQALKPTGRGEFAAVEVKPESIPGATESRAAQKELAAIEAQSAKLASSVKQKLESSPHLKERFGDNMDAVIEEAATSPAKFQSSFQRDLGESFKEMVEKEAQGLEASSYPTEAASVRKWGEDYGQQLEKAGNSIIELNRIKSDIGARVRKAWEKPTQELPGLMEARLNLQKLLINKIEQFADQVGGDLGTNIRQLNREDMVLHKIYENAWKEMQKPASASFNKAAGDIGIPAGAAYFIGGPALAAGMAVPQIATQRTLPSLLKIAAAKGMKGVAEGLPKAAEKGAEVLSGTAESSPMLRSLLEKAKPKAPSAAAITAGMAAPKVDMENVDAQPRKDINVKVPEIIAPEKKDRGFLSSPSSDDFEMMKSLIPDADSAEANAFRNIMNMGAKRDAQGRAALWFALKQNPNYRKYLEKYEEAKNGPAEKAERR